MDIYAMLAKNSTMPQPDNALQGRRDPITTAEAHFVLNVPLKAPLTMDQREVFLGLGCFWGAEKRFWQLPDIVNTAVGYSAGITPNPLYEEVCSGKTGHNEVVRVVYDVNRTSIDSLLKVFWEAHNPTQGMRQGNDVGTQYRSGIYCTTEDQLSAAQASRLHYQKALISAGFGEITSEIIIAEPFYFAEAYHQQYLAKNTNGYCGLGGTGILFQDR